MDSTEPQELKPAKMRRLTLKQRAFVNEYVKTRNGTKAARKVYQNKTDNSNKVAASRLLTKDNVKWSIEKLLRESEYNPKQSIASLIELEQSKPKTVTGADKINASKTLLQLAGLLVNKTQSTSVNLNLDNEDQAFDFLERYKKLKPDTQK